MRRSVSIYPQMMLSTSIFCLSSEKSNTNWNANRDKFSIILKNDRHSSEYFNRSTVIRLNDDRYTEFSRSGMNS